MINPALHDERAVRLEKLIARETEWLFVLIKNDIDIKDTLTRQAMIKVLINAKYRILRESCNHQQNLNGIKMPATYGVDPVNLVCRICQSTVARTIGKKFRRL